MTKITVHIEVDFELPVDSIWPYPEDQPEEINAEEVAKIFKQEGKWNLLTDWMFSEFLDFSVYVQRPRELKQEENLFGEKPDRFIRTSVKDIF